MAVRYWLDSNVLIESKNRWYSFQIAPGFWSFLDLQVRNGEVAASTMVYSELVDKTDDELAEWARERQGEPFFVEPDRAVQDAFAQVANYVRLTYKSRRADEFLGGADGWEIAHAIAHGGILVTRETRVDVTARRVKIPNVADHFGIECQDLFQMLTDLGMAL